MKQGLQLHHFVAQEFKDLYLASANQKNYIVEEYIKYPNII